MRRRRARLSLQRHNKERFAVGRAEPSRNMLAYKSLRGSASSDHLDLVRGGAALAVMLGHLRNLFFVDFSEVAGNSTPLVEIVYLVTGFSHYAVMIFFVLRNFWLVAVCCAGEWMGHGVGASIPRIGLHVFGLC